MIRWRKKVEEYVELRRSLGFKAVGRREWLDSVRTRSQIRSGTTMKPKENNLSIAVP